MEKLWTTSEVARFLGIIDAEVDQLVREGKLTGYKLAGKFLRFRPDQVKDLKEQGGAKPAAAPRAIAARPDRWTDKLRDFWYFYDFYLLSFVLLAALILYLISSS